MNGSMHEVYARDIFKISYSYRKLRHGRCHEKIGNDHRHRVFTSLRYFANLILNFIQILSGERNFKHPVTNENFIAQKMRKLATDNPLGIRSLSA